MDQVILVILPIICIRWPRDDPQPGIKLSAWYAGKMGWEPDDVLFNQTMVQLCHSPWGAMITQHDWEDWTKKNCRHDRAGEMNWNALCLILMSNLFWKVFPSLVPVLHVSMSGVLGARVRCPVPDTRVLGNGKRWPTMGGQQNITANVTTSVSCPLRLANKSGCSV